MRVEGGGNSSGPNQGVSLNSESTVRERREKQHRAWCQSSSKIRGVPAVGDPAQAVRAQAG